MRFPDVNVIVSLMLHFEGAVFAECNLGRSLKQATKKGSDKELAATQIWICVGRAKMCWVSYRKAWNKKSWPLPPCLETPAPPAASRDEPHTFPWSLEQGQSGSRSRTGPNPSKVCGKNPRAAARKGQCSCLELQHVLKHRNSSQLELP